MWVKNLNGGILMYCPKCGAELFDGSVICNVCGEHFEMECQRGKFLMAKKRTLSILNDAFHSNRFFQFCVFISILCGASFISLSSGLGVNAVLTFAFSLTAMIACWQIYSSKEAPDEAKIKKLRWLKKVWRVLSTLTYVALIVVVALLVIVICVVGFAWESFEQEMQISGFMEEFATTLYESGVITYDQSLEILTTNIGIQIIIGILIVAIVAICLLIPFFIVCSSMLKKAQKYIASLEETCKTGEYTAVKCPGKFMIVMGIIYALVFGLSSFSFSLGSTELSSGYPAILPIAMGMYMVCAGAFFNSIHKQELENNRAISAEQIALARVAYLTNEAIKAASAAPTEETPTEETHEGSAETEASPTESPAEESTFAEN